MTEAATRGVLWETLFLENPQNSQENTCARVSFSLKKKLPQCATLLKRRDSGTGVSLKKLPQPATL